MKKNSNVEIDPLRLVLTSNTISLLKQVDEIEDENMSIIHKSPNNLEKSISSSDNLCIDSSNNNDLETNTESNVLKHNKESVRSQYLKDASEAKHYAQDLKYMNSLMAQIQEFKGVGALEKLRRNTVHQFRMKRSYSKHNQSFSG